VFPSQQTIGAATHVATSGTHPGPSGGRRYDERNGPLPGRQP
jgi:hypothetical protein